MRYIDINWLHKINEEPYRLVSEINENQFETRKIEFFKDGTFGYASSQSESINTRLGSVEVPTIEEINSQSEFQGKNISKQEFELLWKQHAIKNS